MRRVCKTLGLFVMALSIVACSSNDDIENAPAELLDFDPEISLKTVWRTSVGNGQGKKYNRLQPAVFGDRIYVASADGVVAAYDTERGKRQWQVDLEERGVSGGVSVADGRVYVGTEDGELIALNASDGSEQWATQVGSEILAPAGSDGAVVAVQTFDGKLVALDANNGAKKWEYVSTVPVLTLRGTSSPIVSGSRVFAGFASGKVVALDTESGRVRWERRVALAKGSSEIDRIVDIDGPMLLIDNILYVGSYQGQVAALDIETGRVGWQSPLSSHVGLGNGFGNVYTADFDGTVTGYNAQNGDVTWQRTELANRQLSDPIAFNSYTVVGDFEGYLHFLSQVDGSMSARINVDGDGVRVPMVTAAGKLFVYGNSGTLVALQIK